MDRCTFLPKIHVALCAIHSMNYMAFTERRSVYRPNVYALSYQQQKKMFDNTFVLFFKYQPFEQKSSKNLCRPLQRSLSVVMLNLYKYAQRRKKAFQNKLEKKVEKNIHCRTKPKKRPPLFPLEIYIASIGKKQKQKKRKQKKTISIDTISLFENNGHLSPVQRPSLIEVIQTHFKIIIKFKKKFRKLKKNLKTHKQSYFFQL